MRKKALSFRTFHDTMVEKCGDGMRLKQTFQGDGLSLDIERVCDNNDKLAVCFPGMGYTCLLYTSRCV